MHDSPRRGLAVGFFDGVHRGHRAILANAAAALTFRVHPLAVLAPERAPKLLMDLDARLAAIRACGVGEVLALDFTPEFARLPPEQFAARFLSGRGPIRCGSNWRFGAGGAGDAASLRRLGFEVEIVPSVEIDGGAVPSTRVRAALAAGRLCEATALLGHPWALRGRIVAGKGEGRALGFPTLNLIPTEEPPLARGVYAVTVAGVRGLANYGVAPTFGDRAWPRPVLEIHFPDGVPPRGTGPVVTAGRSGNDPDPAPQTGGTRSCASATDILFDRFIRPERTFPDLDALRAAIRADLAAFRLSIV